LSLNKHVHAAGRLGDGLSTMYYTGVICKSIGPDRTAPTAGVVHRANCRLETRRGGSRLGQPEPIWTATWQAGAYFRLFSRNYLAGPSQPAHAR